MARKKNSKTKPSAKRTNQKNDLQNLKQLEISILEAPAKISAKLSKMIEAQKKKEIKLKKAFAKVQSDAHKLEAKLKVFTKAEMTPAIKKRLAKFKKSHSEKLKEHTQLNKQLNQMSDELNSLSQQEAKFSALYKHLIQFEKDWKNQSKKNKSTPTKKIIAKKTKAPAPAEMPQEEQHSFFDDVFKHETHEEAETIS